MTLCGDIFTNASNKKIVTQVGADQHTNSAQ